MMPQLFSSCNKWSDLCDGGTLSNYPLKDDGVSYTQVKSYTISHKERMSVCLSGLDVPVSTVIAHLIILHSRGTLSPCWCTHFMLAQTCVSVVVIVRLKRQIWVNIFLLGLSCFNFEINCMYSKCTLPKFHHCTMITIQSIMYVKSISLEIYDTLSLQWHLLQLQLHLGLYIISRSYIKLDNFY